MTGDYDNSRERRQPKDRGTETSISLDARNKAWGTEDSGCYLREGQSRQLDEGWLSQGCSLTITWIEGYIQDFVGLIHGRKSQWKGGWDWSLFPAPFQKQINKIKQTNKQKPSNNSKIQEEWYKREISVFMEALNISTEQFYINRGLVNGEQNLWLLRL